MKSPNFCNQIFVQPNYESSSITTKRSSDHPHTATFTSVFFFLPCTFRLSISFPVYMSLDRLMIFFLSIFSIRFSRHPFVTFSLPFSRVLFHGLLFSNFFVFFICFFFSYFILFPCSSHDYFSVIFFLSISWFFLINIENKT